MSRRQQYHRDVEPDEIFLDSHNLPAFDQQQFEGRIEKSISQASFVFVGVVAVLGLCLFIGRLSYLQLFHGSEYFARSERNSLFQEPIFALRGEIRDRAGVKLAWNEFENPDDAFPKRMYDKALGFAHVLGYVHYPAKDSKGYFWQTAFTGEAGIEKYFNDRLSGQNGYRLTERDARGALLTERRVDSPIDGVPLSLSIDHDVQADLASRIATTVADGGYRGGAGVMMDIYTGELIAITSVPEYNPTILSQGNDTATIKRYLSDTRTPLLNRALAGLYSPGSILKPFVGVGALTEGVITPTKQILSAGYITIDNPFHPEQSLKFKDYNPNNGWVDMRNALRVSSNIYFAEVTGGYKDQKGMGISKLGYYTNLFGLGHKTGVNLLGEKDGTIPSPEWKAKTFPSDPTWRTGDTYNTAIGQYGFQVTPIQMAHAVAGIARSGILVQPTILHGEQPVETDLGLPKDNFRVVREGMHLVATVGTASTLNSVPFGVAAKTGTAQVGAHNEYVNAWIMGFFPYENPKYSFAIVLERAPGTVSVGGQRVAREFLQWLAMNRPEYTK